MRSFFAPLDVTFLGPAWQGGLNEASGTTSLQRGCAKSPVELDNLHGRRPFGWRHLAGRFSRRLAIEAKLDHFGAKLISTKGGGACSPRL
jgi:hypothetical protein